MKFRALATSPDEFDAWVAKVQRIVGQPQHGRLPHGLAAPSEKDPVRYFSTVDPKLCSTTSLRSTTTGTSRNMTDADVHTKG